MSTYIGGQRSNCRGDDQLRPVRFTRNYLKNVLGSCLVEFGDTKVLCAVSIEEGVASWLKGSGKGWLTAEYSLLPASTGKRTRREINGRTGRTQEIQRLIGRSLRAAVDLRSLGEYTITVDCDVIQADGGTRSAAISGAWLALRDALDAWRKAGKIVGDPLYRQIAAVSVGQVAGRILLDLDYHEDSRAEVDMNLVMTAKGEVIEVQGTGEQTVFSRKRLNQMLDLAEVATAQLCAAQSATLVGDNPESDEANNSADDKNGSNKISDVAAVRG